MSNSNNKKIVNTKKKSKKNEKRYIGFLLFAVVLFIAVLFGTVFKDWMQILENNKLTKEYDEYYIELQEEEASLNSEVAKLQDPDYVARYARERYGFTKDGESILTIIDGKVVKTKKEENKTD